MKRSLESSACSVLQDDKDERSPLASRTQIAERLYINAQDTNTNQTPYDINTANENEQSIRPEKQTANNKERTELAIHEIPTRSKTQDGNNQSGNREIKQQTMTTTRDIDRAVNTGEEVARDNEMTTENEWQRAIHGSEMTASNQ